jgi:hypothetical protein
VRDVTGFWFAKCVRVPSALPRNSSRRCGLYLTVRSHMKLTTISSQRRTRATSHSVKSPSPHETVEYPSWSRSISEEAWSGTLSFRICWRMPRCEFLSTEYSVPCPPNEAITDVLFLVPQVQAGRTKCYARSWYRNG